MKLRIELPVDILHEHTGYNVVIEVNDYKSDLIIQTHEINEAHEISDIRNTLIVHLLSFRMV